MYPRIIFADLSRYVLSPTHLHEFKSADRVAWQQPVMSLNLPEQKLGSHSQPDSTSHKFMLKGRQTGTMHRGHSWVFRAESHDTMMAWYEDIESLISKTGEARNAYVRQHIRTVSGMSWRNSSDGMDEDEADRTPYSAESAVLHQERPTSQPREPGGRFPSDVQIDRHLEAPLSPSSGESSGERDLLAAAGSLPDGRDSFSNDVEMGQNRAGSAAAAAPVERHDSYYGSWMSTSDGGRQRQFGQHTQNSNDNRERVGSDRGSTTNLYVAGLGSTNSRDPSLTRQRERGESTSTAPTTTNVTDYTHTTVPTSIDEREESDAQDDTLVDDGVGITKQQSAASVDGSMRTPLAGPVTTDSAAASQTGSLRRPPPQSKNSVSTLELQIPGHYPPTGMAA